MATKTEHNTNMNYIAIDIAKKSNVVLAKNSDGTRSPFRMNNDAKDFDRLLHY